MLRFPNPGSDIAAFIHTFQLVHEELRSRGIIEMDDISAAMVKLNRATSSGFMGEEALRRSANKNRSLDRLYNQSKMYSELYRGLGWFRSMPVERLRFVVTLLGHHVAAASYNVRALFVECALGMVFPNAVLAIKGEFALRPFACTLRAMAELDGVICRDELIVGPLCLANDRDHESFGEMVERLRTMRSRGGLSRAMTEVQRVRRIQPTTMGNYTRFPLAALQYTGWTRKADPNPFPGGVGVGLELTEAGRRQVTGLQNMIDVRAIDIQNERQEIQAAFARLCFYEMLARAEFVTEPVAGTIEEDRRTCTTLLSRLNVSGVRPALFSPFQELDDELLALAFGDFQPKETEHPTKQVVTVTSADTVPAVERLSGTVVLEPIASPVVVQEDAVARELREYLALANGDAARAIDALMDRYSASNRDDFYPVVAQLFRLIGLACEASPFGRNPQRWDAMICDPVESIPIEIKSPGEELFISVKGVRQALENKIILLSRKQHPTSFDTTSLVVGFNSPTDRSEVLGLIADIKRTFGIRVGVIDFRALLTMALGRIHGRHVVKEQITRLNGIIDVHNP